MGTIHDCKLELWEARLRATPARLALMGFLESQDKPIDVQTMIGYLSSKGIKTDPATVFRIVNILADKGIIRPIQFNEGRTRYEVYSKGDHHHLICEICGKIEDVSDSTIPDLEKEILKKKKFKVLRHALEFFGLCQNCQY